MSFRTLWILAALSAGTVLAQTPPEGSAPPGGDEQGNSNRQARREAVLKACAEDIKSLCAGQQGREVMQCLRTNSDKLTPDCESALPKGGRHGGRHSIGT